MLVEENETLSDNDIISEKLNNFFGDIRKILDISQYDDHLVNTNNIDDPVLRERKILKSSEYSVNQMPLWK